VGRSAPRGRTIKSCFVLSGHLNVDFEPYFFSVGALQGHQDRGECEHQQGFQRQDLCFGQVRQLTLKGLSHEMDLAFDDMNG
jgi:hypothetical protein